MPLINIRTNIKVVDSNFLLKDSTKKVAEILTKPEKYMMVILVDKEKIAFAGTTEPTASIEIKGISLPLEKINDYCKKCTLYFSEILEVPSERIYIEFTDANAKMWGWNGSTF